MSRPSFQPPTGRGWWSTLGLLLGLLLAETTVVVVVGWLLTHPLAGPLRHENAVNRWFVDRRTTSLTAVADAGTWVGETAHGVAIVVVVAALVAAWRRTWWPLLLAAAVEGGLGLFYLAGTTIDPRDRPPVHILQSGLVPDASFPSGHSATATAVALVPAVLLWTYARVAPGLLALLAVVPLWTMTSRLYLGAHHVTDVCTGALAATVWVLLCARLLLPEPRSA